MDVLREQYHKYSRYSVELGDIKTRINELETTREDMMGDILRHQQLQSFNSVTSNESVEFIATTNVSQAVNESTDFLNMTNVSQTNNQLDETLVLPPQVQLECLREHDEPLERQTLKLQLVGKAGTEDQAEDDSVPEDEKDGGEESHGTEVTTHPLTARTLEDRDSLDGDSISQDERVRNLEDWNFSSVQTVDDKSVDEVRSSLSDEGSDNLLQDHQKQLIEKMFKRQNPTNELEEANNSSGCFSSWMLPLFVKVFD